MPGLSVAAAAFFAQRTQLFARWLERLPLGDAHQQGGAAAEATEEEPPAGSPAEGLDRAGAGVGAPGEADQESEGRALLAGAGALSPAAIDPPLALGAVGAESGFYAGFALLHLVVDDRSAICRHPGGSRAPRPAPAHPSPPT